MFKGKFFIRLVFKKMCIEDDVEYDMLQEYYKYGEVKIYSNFEDDFDYEGDFALLDDWIRYGEDKLVRWVDDDIAFLITLDDYHDNINIFCSSLYDYLEDNEIEDKDLWEKVENLDEVATNLSYCHDGSFNRNIHALKEAYYDFVKVAKEKNII